MAGKGEIFLERESLTGSITEDVENLTLKDTRSQNFLDEILRGLENRVPKVIKKDEYDTIEALCTDSLSPCHSKQGFLVTVLNEASVAHEATLAAHPSWHGFQLFLRRIIDPIDRFSAALDILSQVAGSTGMLIWGSIRIVIQATKDLTEIPIFVNNCLEDLERALPLWDEYQHIIREDPQCRIRGPAIRVCIEYLTFCILVTRALKSNIWKEILLAATKSLETQLRQCITAIQEQRNSIHYWFGASTYRKTHQILTGIDHLLNCRSATTMTSSEKKILLRPIRSVPGGWLSQRFFGRDEELAWLESELEPGSPHNSGRRVALWGMTGIGKTQLMLKYEQKFGETYQAASLFLVGGSRDKFIQSCQNVLDVLELPERERPEPNMKIHGLGKWLNEVDGWLLIIDNVSSSEIPDIQNLLESTKKGHVLVSSQSFAAVDKIVGNEKACREIRGLSKQDATTLFLTTSNTEEDSKNLKLAADIVKEAGYLPHVIDQAAWYVKKHDIDLKQYLKRYRETPSKILQWQDQHRSAPVKHFEMEFQDLRHSHPDAMNLLCLFSFFEPESIPRFEGWYRNSDYIVTHDQRRETARDKFSVLRYLRSLCCISAKPSMTQGTNNLISDGAESYSRVIEVCENHARLEDAIGELWNFNHVRKTPKRGILWMHDITRRMASDSINQKEYHKWLESAIIILYHTFPERDHTTEDHEVVDIYLPQATALLAQAQDHNLDCGKYAGLLVLCAQCYHHRAEYRKAIEWYEKAQVHYNGVLKASDPRRITLLHDLAWSYRESGAHKRAEEMFHQTWQLRSVHQGRYSPEALESLSDLAALIERSGRLKEAEKLFIDLHNSQIATFGADHPITVAGAHNLALCYANQGRMSEAEVLYRETLDISERALGKDDEGTIKTVGNLAVTLDHYGKLGEAEPLYERALEMYTRLFGYDHLLSLRVRSNLSGLYRQQGRFGKAENVIREVLAAFLETLGKSHCHIAEAMYDIAEVLHDQGSLYDAGNIYKACIDMWEHEAPGHPLKFRVMDAAGILERERGELEKSRSWSETAYNDNLKLLGWLDPYTLVAANNYAELLHAEGQYTEASRFYEDCLQGFEELLGDRHSHYFMVLNNLGRLSWAIAGRDAMPFFSQAWQGLKILLGETHFCTLTVQLNLARTYLAAGESETASSHMLKIKEAYMQDGEINHPRLGVVEFFLGILSASKGNPDSTTAAVAHFKAAEENYLKTLGASHPNYLWARCMLIRTLYGCGRTEEANIYLSNIEPHFLLDVHNGAVDSGLGKLTFRSMISTEFKELNWIPLIQIPFGETIRLRWGRKTVWRIWREPDLNKLHS